MIFLESLNSITEEKRNRKDKYLTKGTSIHPIDVICHKCKFSHGEIFGAGPDVGLCLLGGWSLLFL